MKDQRRFSVVHDGGESTVVITQQEDGAWAGIIFYIDRDGDSFSVSHGNVLGSSEEEALKVIESKLKELNYSVTKWYRLNRNDEFTL